MAVRTIEVRERLMAKNDEYAAEVRRRLAASSTIAVNLVSSPGSGKTRLLERTLEALDAEIPMAVVTGDVQTQNDADRLARYTSRLVQAVVTGGACHLDARQMVEALDALALDGIRLLFVENVGNLVCPAGWDLGENVRVVVFSVTEGEDKPLKYPKMFRTAHYAVLNKVDLLPYVPFDPVLAEENARSINPAIQFIRTSAHTGEGLAGWFDFLRELAAGADSGAGASRSGQVQGISP